jgi:hypothetical protein
MHERCSRIFLSPFRYFNDNRFFLSTFIVESWVFLDHKLIIQLPNNFPVILVNEN